MVRGKKRCSANVYATAISMSITRSRVVTRIARGLEASLLKRNKARTYLFLHIMRLGPAACSGGTAVFFLAIGPSEGVTAQKCETIELWMRRI